MTALNFILVVLSLALEGTCWRRRNPEMQTLDEPSTQVGDDTGQAEAGHGELASTGLVSEGK